jgi:predicted cupin superfamily sugar epimerase
MNEQVEQLVAQLQLTSHPEGGFFRRFHESPQQILVDGVRRPALTAIHYLLGAGQGSAWHRIDAEEVWQWQAGAPLELLLWEGGDTPVQRTELGALADGRVSLTIVPKGVWQAARPLGSHALVSCLVAPGFVWSGFELMDPQGAEAQFLRRCENWI